MTDLIWGILFAALIAVVATIIILRSRMNVRPAKKPPLLRAQILGAPPEEIGIAATGNETWAAVMDLVHPVGTASVVALVDGSASIYLSTGGVVLGGGANEQVRHAAVAFVRAADAQTASMEPSTIFSLPETGHTRFYVRSSAGVVMADALESELVDGDHHLSDLFYAGQNVITQLRLASEGS